MKQATSLVENNGSFYLLIPPALMKYLNLKVGKEQVIVEDKEKSKGRFAAFWAADSDGKEKE